MGRWMEALNEKGEVEYEMAPNFLIYCAKRFPKNDRNHFPILSNLDLNSDKWIDESQLFNPSQISKLKNEIEQVQKILNKEVFVPNLNIENVLKYWITNEYKLENINSDIRTLLAFFEKSIKLNLEIKVYL
ncbi:hypothetical protein [uncultured Tenacibaculum sp.]|uniref:hypothetical protein n=1 Tax=uncultured Tenacibaculum sp. TaxID=174713 RepID=UPI002604E514|nr:hypothetical protein [uncultured Tenacibaculum sp.]